MPQDGTVAQRRTAAGGQCDPTGGTRSQNRHHSLSPKYRGLGHRGLHAARYGHDGYGTAYARHLHGRYQSDTADLYGRQDYDRASTGPYWRRGCRRKVPHDTHGRTCRGRQCLLDIHCRRAQGANAGKLLHPNGYALPTDGNGTHGGHGHRKRPAAYRSQTYRATLPVAKGAKWG